MSTRFKVIDGNEQPKDTKKSVINLLLKEIKDIEEEDLPLKKAFIVFCYGEEHEYDNFSYSAIDLDIKDFLYIVEKIKSGYLSN